MRTPSGGCWRWVPSGTPLQGLEPPFPQEMGVSDSKHFLILFRDAGCQFRGLYSYQPEREEVGRLFGVGPRTVTAPMMDLFFKYNSGAKSFSRIHTKHLTVTIDAFTIHNSLWAAKRAPRKDS
ncbi:unnamed protein product [Ixodes persulcatus]